MLKQQLLSLSAVELLLLIHKLFFVLSQFLHHNELSVPQSFVILDTF